MKRGECGAVAGAREDAVSAVAVDKVIMGGILPAPGLAWGSAQVKILYNHIVNSKNNCSARQFSPKKCYKL
jgi:hypothetical protein